MNSMSDNLSAQLRSYLRNLSGLSFFMAWIYGSFYSATVWTVRGGLLAEGPWLALMGLSGALGMAD